MKELALVLNKKNRAASSCRTLSGFFKKLAGILGKWDIGSWVTRVNVYEDLVIHIVYVPYTADVLKKSIGKRIKKAIADYFIRMNISGCLFASELKGLQPEGTDTSGARFGKLLFKALLLDCLKDICSHNGQIPGDTEICIIQDRKPKELVELVRLLAPLLKFVTVISSDREALQEELHAIWAETGLATALAEDIKKGIKNADIVVNMGPASDFPASCRLKRNAVVLQCGEGDIKNISGNTVVINGLKFSLPGKLAEKLGKDALLAFEPYEISEMILRARLDFDAADLSCGFERSLMQQVAAEFRQEGYRIISYKGRHSILSPGDLAAVMQNRN